MDRPYLQPCSAVHRHVTERSRVQHFLIDDDRATNWASPRREDDKVIFLSGLYSDDHERLLRAKASLKWVTSRYRPGV